MKNAVLAFTLCLAATVPAIAQTQTRERRSMNRVQQTSEPPSVGNRSVDNAKFENHSDKQKTAVDKNSPATPWGNTAIQLKPAPDEETVALSGALENRGGKSAATQRSRVTGTTVLILPGPSVSNPVSAGDLSALTNLYRVGVGDVLDIRLVNAVTRESTLFTVLRGGVVEYPLLPQPLSVGGLTTGEIARRITSAITVIKNAQVTVGVRDYASHGVLVTGIVDNPGRKILRREAIPLYAVLAEALPHADATFATITRHGLDEVISLAGNQAQTTLVTAGDMIKISSSPKQFIYVAGDVPSFGEKEFREGMTLTQALMSAGGIPESERIIARIARRNASGFLVTEQYEMHAIRAGKARDPRLQPGDRIEIKRRV